MNVLLPYTPLQALTDEDLTANVNRERQALKLTIASMVTAIDALHEAVASLQSMRPIATAFVRTDGQGGVEPRFIDGCTVAVLGNDLRLTFSALRPSVDYVALAVNANGLPVDISVRNEDETKLDWRGSVSSTGALFSLATNTLEIMMIVQGPTL